MRCPGSGGCAIACLAMIRHRRRCIPIAARWSTDWYAGWREVNVADDLTQQVFLQAFRKLDQYRGQAKFQTWLYRLAVNEVLQWVRRRRSPVGPLLADPPEPKAGVAARVEQRDMLDWALKQLDPELRAVFLLKEQHGQSYREIAEAVGIPEGTVGSRMNRARQQLRNLLTLAGWEG
ncbi:MAG: RNA polymerase sigma factor [Pirellulaceae bacterium]|nr:MAG: RNA polymerase sigma factor [Pirellulaceae bacterium]